MIKKRVDNLSELNICSSNFKIRALLYDSKTKQRDALEVLSDYTRNSPVSQ